MKRLAAGATLAIVAAGALFVAFYANPAAGVGAGYIAKVACSEIFLAGRNKDAVLKLDFNGISPLLDYVNVEVDEQSRQVKASLFGLGRARAIYRDFYGCTLVRGGAPVPLPSMDPAREQAQEKRRFFLRYANDDVDRDAINTALDKAFADPVQQTRAIFILKDGMVIAERYATGFSAETPLLSWSMAKSVTATMIGAAVNKGLIDINSPASAEEWKGDADRSEITWNDLMQMQSGLAFDEDYGDTSSDVNRMLFRSRAAGSVAAAKPLAHPTGTFWAYSSGTTNLLQRLLRQTLDEAGVNYHRFAYEEIFGPIGAPSFTLEPDASGTFVGSSFVYATARDWAKLGQLYLKGGVVDGVEILPDGWTNYVAAPASASDDFYGAQFWLNRPGRNGRRKYIPGVPDDAYLMAGHEGQYVLIIPDKNMVIVRAGMTRGVEAMPLVAPVFEAIYAAVR